MGDELTEELRTLRRELHRHPECSGEEKETAERIGSFLASCNPDKILTGLGGYGLAALFDSGKEGPTVMLRAETDALPIPETADLPHGSLNDGVSHKCGHDGHMAILCGVAASLRERKIRSGRLVLLFQPGEETGEGARRVGEDERFGEITPDYLFALHSWPGFPYKSVVIKEGGMFAASTGLSIELTGKSAHAMAPEEGISPAEALKRIHSRLESLHHPDKKADDFSLITTVDMNLGAEDYGVSPGKGFLYLTVRAYKDNILAPLVMNIKNLAEEIAREEQLEVRFKEKDSFPAGENSAVCAEQVRRAAEANELSVLTPARGMASSEDIGHLFNRSRRGGALFLIGSGEAAPALHSFNFDFDDGLIPCGLDMLLTLIDGLLGRERME